MIYDRARKHPPGSILTGMLTMIVLGLVVGVIGLSIEGMANDLASGPQDQTATIAER